MALMGGDNSEDVLEFAYDGTRVRLDRDFAASVERSLEMALDDAYEHDEDMLGLLFCGCNTCITRVLVAVTIARTVEGIETGLVERV